MQGKKTRVQHGGTLAIGEAQDLLNQKDIDRQLREGTRATSSCARRTRLREKHRGVYGTPGHDARTGEMNTELSEESEST